MKLKMVLSGAKARAIQRALTAGSAGRLHKLAVSDAIALSRFVADETCRQANNRDEWIVFTVEFPLVDESSTESTPNEHRNP